MQARRKCREWRKLFQETTVKQKEACCFLLKEVDDVKAFLKT